MNAKEVLVNVERLLQEAEETKDMTGRYKRYPIVCVYKDLGIYDWWSDWLSVSQLRQMRGFLKTAISLGFVGYACFKVGSRGCTHGMWAYEMESTTGFSPEEGACLLHSFVGGEHYFDYCDRSGKWMGDKRQDGRFQFTLKEVKSAMLMDRV